MPLKINEAFELALDNIIHHGDTDIFPFPFENYIFHDSKTDVLDLLDKIHSNFNDFFNANLPSHIRSLAPVGYTGFRWASQLDPIWNAYFLGIILSISPEIESSRLPLSTKQVFSYRFRNEKNKPSLFADEGNWHAFMMESIERAKDCSHVVICDIADFYGRLNHHRLENALQQINSPPEVTKKILHILSNFSNSNSYGLPIGGPAARILSELTLDQVDKLLRGAGIIFTRYADDYHIFTNSSEDAYAALIFLSEKLIVNQGLALQKSKTRIQTSAEFQNTALLIAEREAEDTSERAKAREKFLGISLRFDPYSPTRHQDYEALQQELSKFDIIGMLKDELTKSRIHIALASRIVKALRYLGSKEMNNAALTIIQNTDILYPILSSVIITLTDIHERLDPEVQDKIHKHFRSLISNNSHVVRTDIIRAYLVRLFSKKHLAENEDTLQRLYADTQSELIRRDVILVMAKWRVGYWLSDKKNYFNTFGPWERRAFIVASYMMTEEGKHWREHTKRTFLDAEKLVQSWASVKKQDNGLERLL